MPNLLVFDPAKFFLDNKYSFKIIYGDKATKIKMLCREGEINTKELPRTFHILSEFLPSILTSKCFNDSNKPFFEEVMETEIAHLFEHILLEYFCQFKLAEGYKRVIVSGVTDWNWRKDCFGTFRITINTGKSDNEFFLKAFEKSLELLRKIIDEDVVVN